MMDRNVYARHPVTTVDEGKPAPPPVQPKPAEKLLKYFPAEAFALYATLEPLTDTAFDGTPFKWAMWTALGISVVFCAMFLRRFWAVQRRRQIAISCIALVVYVAALGGPFATLDWFKPAFALIAAALMSAFIIFMPAPTAPEA